MELSVKDIVDYVLKNRGEGKNRTCFREWTAEDIARYFASNVHNGTAAYFTDEKTGKLTGVVTGYVVSPTVFHVDNILTTDRRCIKAFIVLFERMYPGFSIRATRQGKLIYYNTERLCNLLKRIS